MKTQLILILAVTTALTGCATVRESRINPMNWFDSSREEARPDLGETGAVEDNRPLVPSVTSLTIERTSSGAIVRAEAVMPSVGWWDAQLVAENFGRPQDGTLTFRFVAAAPVQPIAGSETARTISAVYPLTQGQLDTTPDVVVVGEANSRRARR